MKRIISLLIASLMIISMFGVVSAADLQYYNFNVNADIKLKFQGETAYQDNISSTTPTPVNLWAKLDMINVRNAAGIAANNQETLFNELKGEADATKAGFFTATVTVKIVYPNTLTISEADKLVPEFKYATDGNTAPFLFQEDKSKREITAGADNTSVLTMTLTVPETKLKDLNDNKDTWLDDIVLEAPTLNIAIPAMGAYAFKGTVECVTELYTKDASDQKVEPSLRIYTFKTADPADTATATFASAPSIGGGGSYTKIDVKSSKESGEIPAGTKVKLSPTISTGKVYYTTDRTEPSIDSKGNLEGTTKLFTNDLVINEDTTVKAIAVTANGKTKSNVRTWEYTVVGVDVAIDVPSGVVKAGQEVEITTKTGKEIYYTTDGTDPQIDENGNPVGTTKKYTEPIVVTENMTVKAIAVSEDGTVSVIATESYVLAPGLAGEHIAYIQGDDLGNFNPEMPITRAEVATIFSRITVKKMHVESDHPVSFTDVSEDNWYYDAVAFMESVGVIKGYEDGSFRPDNYITRAEFAAMASRYDKLEDINENIFSDVSSLHWAFMMVNSASKKGWVSGYPDGTFQPEANIKRCEAVTVVNRMLGRQAEAEFKNADLTGLIIFPDAKDIEMHWAFYEVVESSNTHDYE